MPSPSIVQRLEVEEKIGSRLLSCVVDGIMDQFAFQSTKEAFHRSVVVIAAEAVRAGLDGVLALHGDYPIYLPSVSCLGRSERASSGTR